MNAVPPRRVGSGVGSGLGDVGGSPRPVLRLADLTEDLAWPRLLRAPVLALDPSRLGLAFVAVVVAALLVQLAGAITGGGEDRVGVDAVAGAGVVEAWSSIAGGVVGVDGGRVGEGLVGLVVGVPASMVSAAPITGTLLLGVLIALAALVIGSLSRMSVCDESAGAKLSWTEGLRFGVTRFGSLLTAVLVPLGVVWLIAFGLRAVGWVVFSVPVLDVVGGLGFGLALLLSLIAVGSVVAMVFGWPMLLSAVSADAVDGVDAVQRAYAYVFGRPLRLVVYTAVLVVQGLLMFLIVSAICVGLVRFAVNMSFGWAPEPARIAVGLSDVTGERAVLEERIDRLRSQREAFEPGHGEFATLSGQIHTAERDLKALTPGATRVASGTLVRVWSVIPLLIPSAFAVSYIASASVLLYLVMRRLNDGQDVRDIWMPGRVPGTVSDVGSGTPVRVAGVGEGGVRAAGGVGVAGEAAADDDHDDVKA